MSTFRLRTYDLAPPGGFPYEQTTGIYRSFPSVPLIEAQAQTVSDFRKGNGLPRASVREALEDVDAYTCARLGNMRGFCTERDPKSPATIALNQSSPIVAPCGGCGAPIT